MVADAFAQYAAHLLDGGYSPIPLLPGTKRPLFEKNWDRLRSLALEPEEIADLCRQHHDLGLGVAGGFENLVPIDIDTEEPKIARAILDALPPILVAKKGQKGLTPFYWDAYGTIKEGRKFRRPRKDGGFDMLVEVLVTGQSVIPPTIHPDTGRPYEWLTRRTLFSETLEELPVITVAHIDAMEEALKPWLPSPRLVKFAPKRQAPERPAAGSRMEAYARAALAGEVQVLSGLSCGRNWALYLAASRLGKYVHHGILPEAEAQAALESATQRNGYAAAKHGGMKKARATLRSGLEKAKGDPLPDLSAQNRNQNRKIAK
jgi:hypothetical protein